MTYYNIEVLIDFNFYRCAILYIRILFNPPVSFYFHFRCKTRGIQKSN